MLYLTLAPRVTEILRFGAIVDCAPVMMRGAFDSGVTTMVRGAFDLWSTTTMDGLASGTVIMVVQSTLAEIIIDGEQTWIVPPLR